MSHKIINNVDDNMVKEILVSLDINIKAVLNKPDI